jgi:hypothetical protein
MLESVRQLDETPALQRHAQPQLLFVVEFGRSARCNRVDELLEDRVAAADALELLEQRGSLLPADIDERSSYVDLYAVQTAARLHGSESTSYESPTYGWTGLVVLVAANRGVRHLLICGRQARPSR